MTPKPSQPNSKAGSNKPSPKSKGTSETARLFIDITEVIRRTQTMSPTRYVE